MATKKLQIVDYTVKQAENADTLDNKHASDFASATDMATAQSNISDLQTKVGDSSVSEQISTALVNNQSDWNQNNSSAADYIKNRPFYTGDPVKTEIIPATTVTFSEDCGLMAAIWPETFDAVEGQTYMISWDGTDYICAGILFNGIPFLGNLAIFGIGSDTGEPFIFLNQGQRLVVSTESATAHVIGISEYAAQIVTLDEKYIPKRPDAVTAYNFSTMVLHDQMVAAITAFNTGNASIVWDGKKVLTASYNSSDDTISVTFAEEPLRILTYSNDNGIYNALLGKITYREVQGNQVRIGDGSVYAVLYVVEESGDEIISTTADRISFGNGSELSKTALILDSSTEGPPKKFKITVDDNGVPSTTNTTDSTNKKLATEDYVDAQISAIDVSGQISTHNSDASAHSDIRTSISNLNTLVGDSSVSSQISTAINAIDYPVDSVNGKTGAITLTASDVGALPANTTIPSIDGLATETYVNNKVAGIVNSAPETLDTLNELAAALGNDPNFATTVATQIGNKVDKIEGKGLSTNDYTNPEKSKLAGIETGANKTTIDSTLSVSGNAADAKATGDAISNLSDLVGDTAVSDQIAAATVAITNEEIDEICNMPL